MESAFTALTETGVLGTLLVLALIAIGFLFRLLMASINSRFEDHKELSDKYRDAVQSQTDATNNLARILEVRNG